MDSEGTIRDENVRGNNSGYLLFEMGIISLFWWFWFCSPLGTQVNMSDKDSETTVSA